MVTREEADKILKEKFGIEIEKDIKLQFLELTSGKNKDWAEATELLVSYILKRLKIYTTKDDLKSEVWVYKDGIYLPQGRSEIKELLREVLGEQFTTYIFNQVISKIEPDTFIDANTFFKNDYTEEIPIKNGILNIITLELKPFTDSKIFFNKLPVEFNIESSCPKIDSFLKDVLAKEEDVKVFYEIAGFCLLKEYKFEKAFMFVGDGRNGKDKSLELVKRLIGVNNCCAIPLSSLVSESFIISEFFGKMANIAGDIGNKDLKETSEFKALTGRSIKTAPRKFMTPLTFVNYAKFIFACNELPMVYDSSRGFWDRWVLLEFPFTFVSEEELNNSNEINLKLRDESIIEKITSPSEMSGFLNKALEGLHRVMSRKEFSSTLGSKEIKDLWIRKSNSVMAFCIDCVEEDYDNFVAKRDFRKKYSTYCKKHKIKSKSDYVIKRSLEEMYGAIEENREFLGKWQRSWGGITWKK